MLFKRKNKKVDFLIIGAQKSGTSALHHYLSLHPQIGVPKKKELHFFDDEQVFAGINVDYSLYENEFERSKEIMLYGESTPIYMYWKPSCKRIYQYNKNIKLIAILRNPIERAFSHWNMEFTRGDDTQDFSSAIRLEPKRLIEVSPLQHRVHSYIDRGLYADQINRYKSLFSEEQLLFLKYEDFKSNQEVTLAKVFQFLGVDDAKYDFTPMRIHENEYVQQLPENDHKFLRQKFESDIKAVEKILSWDCSDWLK